MTGSVNTDFNNPKFNVGLLVPPDKVNRFVMYSDKEANSNIKVASHDVFVKSKKPRFEDRFKTPKSVFYSIGAAVLTVGALVLRKSFKK